MINKIQTKVIDGITIRYSTPGEQRRYPVLLLLHGLTGDEYAMWVFASRLPDNAIIIAPRGIYYSVMSGYGWHSSKSKDWPWVDDFSTAIESLLGLLIPENFPKADMGKIHLLGFSQGAALAYSFAMLHPNKIETISGLSGFMPKGAEALAANRPLLGKPVFVTHGKKDDIVEIEHALKSVRILTNAGADVTYCEDDVGHKLSASCYNGLETFYRKNN